jgi:hypothetical protein
LRGGEAIELTEVLAIFGAGFVLPVFPTIDVLCRNIDLRVSIGGTKLIQFVGDILQGPPTQEPLIFEQKVVTRR